MISIRLKLYIIYIALIISPTHPWFCIFYESENKLFLSLFEPRTSYAKHCY
jgi:hypothetical protein